MNQSTTVEQELKFDHEWVELMMEAKSMGLTITQVKEFLTQTPTSEEPKLYR